MKLSKKIRRLLVARLVDIEAPVSIIEDMTPEAREAFLKHGHILLVYFNHPNCGPGSVSVGLFDPKKKITHVHPRNN